MAPSRGKWLRLGSAVCSPWPRMNTNKREIGPSRSILWHSRPRLCGSWAQQAAPLRETTPPPMNEHRCRGGACLAREYISGRGQAPRLPADSLLRRTFPCSLAPCGRQTITEHLCGFVAERLRRRCLPPACLRISRCTPACRRRRSCGSCDRVRRGRCAGRRRPSC